LQGNVSNIKVTFGSEQYACYVYFETSKHNKVHENRIQVCPNFNSHCEEHYSSLKHSLFNPKAEGSALQLRSVRNKDQCVWQLLRVAVGFCALCAWRGGTNQFSSSVCCRFHTACSTPICNYDCNSLVTDVSFLLHFLKVSGCCFRWALFWNTSLKSQLCLYVTFRQDLLNI